MRLATWAAVSVDARAAALCAASDVILVDPNLAAAFSIAAAVPLPAVSAAPFPNSLAVSLLKPSFSPILPICDLIAPNN